MPSWQSTSRIGCPIDNPARRSRGAAPSTRPQWTRVPLDFRPRWRYVVNKAGAANAAPALKYKFYFTPHFCGYTEFGIVPRHGGRKSPCRWQNRYDLCNNFLIQLYNFLGHSLLSPFECLCGNFILPEPASYVFFYAFFNLRNLLYIIDIL